MKKYLLLFISCMMFSSAYAWGLLPETPNGNSLLFWYLGQEQVVQPVCIRTHVEKNIYTKGLPSDIYGVNEDQIIASLQTALNWWLQQVPATIKARGREEEFADFLTTIPKSVQVKKQATCEGDHVLIFTYNPYGAFVEVVEENGHKVLKHRRNPILTHIPGVNVYSTIADASSHSNYYEIRWWHPHFLTVQDMGTVLPHEVGHLYGLADQYSPQFGEDEEERIHPYFSYMSLFGEYGDWDRNNKSLQVHSIFGQGRHDYSTVNQIPPDDVDGFINAVDFVQFYEKGRLSQRISGGWSSFALAHKHVYYAYAMPFIYTGTPEKLSVPESIFARIKKLQNVRSSINVDDIRKMEYYYTALIKYVETLESKIKQMDTKDGILHRDHIKDFTDQELKDLMERARYVYYDERLLAASTLLADHYHGFHRNVTKNTRSREDLNRERKEGVYSASRAIDGKRYYAYDPEQMKQLLAATAEFVRLYPDFIEHPEQIVEEQLKQTSTRYIVNSLIKHCAICGEELSDGDAQLIPYRVGPRYSYFWIHQSEYSKMVVKGKVVAGFAPLKQYTFKTQKAAEGKYIPVTYQMAYEELQARHAAKQVQEQVDPLLTDNESHKPVAPPATRPVGKPKTSGRTSGKLPDLPKLEIKDDFPFDLPDPLAKPPSTTKPASQSGKVASAEQEVKAKGKPGESKQVVPGQSSQLPKGQKPTLQTSATPVKASVKVSTGSVSLPVKPSTSVPVKPAAAPVEPEKPTVQKAELPKGVQQIQEGEKIRCEICGKELKTGDLYYQHEGHHVHRSSQCAYDYFAKRYGTDEESIQKYEAVYWFGKPKKVKEAKELLTALGLTHADLRRFRSRAGKTPAASPASKQAAAAPAMPKGPASDDSCNFYLIVTEADVSRFEQENAGVLRTIKRKQTANQELSKQEKLVAQNYAQLKQNQAKTVRCAGNNAAAGTKVKRSDKSSRTDYFQALATFQQNARKKSLDGNGVVNGFYELTDIYFNIREKRPYLTALSNYMYINRSLASGSEGGTVADYMQRVLTGKEGVNVPLAQRYSKAELMTMRQGIAADKRAFAQYAPVIRKLEKIRREVANMVVDKEVAAGRISSDRLTFTQKEQIAKLVVLYRNLGKEIHKITDVNVLHHIATGLEKDPIQTRGEVYIQTGVFLARYGRFASVQSEGVMLAKVGEKLQQSK